MAGLLPFLEAAVLFHLLLSLLDEFAHDFQDREPRGPPPHGHPGVLVPELIQPWDLGHLEKCNVSNVSHPVELIPTHRCCSFHVSPNGSQHAPDVSPLFQEPILLGEGQGAHHIKGKVLEPVCQVKRLLRLDESGVQLAEHDLQHLVDKDLQLKDIRLGEQRRDGAFELFVEILVTGVEYRWQ